MGQIQDEKLKTLTWAVFAKSCIPFSQGCGKIYPCPDQLKKEDDMMGMLRIALLQISPLGSAEKTCKRVSLGAGRPVRKAPISPYSRNVEQWIQHI